MNNLNLQSLNDFNFAAVFGIFCSVLSILWTIAFPLLVIGFLWSAFLFLFSGGDEERIARARSTFVMVVVAAVIVFIAGGIPSVIADALGVTPPPSCT